MREKVVEEALVKAVKCRGGLALKLTSPSWVGIPDRLVLLPQGRLGFVEVKAPGKVPRPLQVRRLEQLKNLGFKVYVLDSLEKIEGVLDDLQTT
ncbi:VRR-NUC domain-containing protein [Streptococcus pluranimalium]|uniref:Nuclease n=1 Tax=Streptococcus pluranimalium TaxID=82348 RepID=A0A2L0D4J6_9STRE|nr:VRR-NUC domain-containing protein [Streptococcus pluranimalium]AUW96762.1 nuclease [Streptococcus pluranimalium]HEL2651148.1 VRR-NUC domain-containing protein [Streptococcus suis]